MGDKRVIDVRERVRCELDFRWRLATSERGRGDDGHGRRIL